MEDETKREKPKKKRKGPGCCGCLAIFCLVFVLVIGSGVGVGWYFGDKYMKQYFDMPLTDAFGVVGALYKADEKKIVTNAPGDGDEDKFYHAVGESLYLKDGTLTAENFAAISGSLKGETTDNTENSGESGGTGKAETEKPVDAQVKAVRKAAAEGDAKTALENLISRDNMDVDKIRGKFTAGYDYENNYTVDFTAEVADKELFAVVKTALDAKMKEQNNALLEFLSFEQLTLGKSDAGNAVASLVAKLDLKGLLEKQLESAPAFAKWAATTLLPKHIFVTASVEAGEKLTVDILINQMDEKGKENVYKIIGDILKLQGAENTDAKAYLSDMVNDAMGEAVRSIDGVLDLSGNVSDGKIRLDVYSALAATAFKDNGVTKVELAEAYTSVVAADVDKMIGNNEKLLFENKWEVEEGGKIVEKYSVTEIEGATRIDYGDRFTAEFERKYLMRTEFYRVGEKTYFDPVWTDEGGNVYKQAELDLDGAHPTAGNARLYRLKTAPHTVKAEITEAEQAAYDELALAEYVDLGFDDLAALMGVGTSEKTAGLKLEGLFDSSKLTEKLGGGKAATREEQFLHHTDDELRFDLTDKMLARLMAEQTKSVFESGNGLTSSFGLKFVGLTKGDEETITITDEEGNVTGTRTIERRFMTVGFTAKTADVIGSGGGMINSLIGDEIGVIVKLDVTPGLEDKYLNAPELEYADLGKERTDDLVATLGKIGASSLKPEELDRQLGKPVRDLIGKMSDTLGEVTVENGGLSVPNVFSLLSSQLFPVNAEKTFGGAPIAIGGADIHIVLKGVYDLPTLTADGDKHYIARKAGSPYDYEVQTEKTDRLNDIESVYAAVGKPDADLGKVLGYYEDASSNMMYLSYDYSLAQYLDGSSSDMSLLSVEEVVVTFVIDKSQTEVIGGQTCYKTKMWVNDMPETDRTLLEKMITYFDQSNEHKFPELEAKVGAFAHKLVNTPVLKNYVDNGTVIGG